jgi:transposase
LAILEKELLVPYHATTVKYYEHLGYEFPKYIDKQNRVKIKRGTKILVKVEDLPKNSIMKLTKICDECGKHIFEQTYEKIIQSRENGDGKDRCKNCSAIYNGNNRKNNVKYEKSLEFYAINNNKKYLLNEFSEKNNKTPIEVSYGSAEVYWWNCPNCKSEYDMKVSDRTGRSSNCPYCSGYRVNETNCLKTTHANIAMLLKNPQRGYKITAGSNQMEVFVCDKCGYETNKKVANVVINGFSCDRCSDGISYGEKFMINLLYQLNVNFESQKIFKWSNNKRYDFYIKGIGIIEIHGLQHYERSFNDKRTVIDEQENDKLKEELARKNGIENYIVIDCRKSTLDWLKKEILKSKLSELFDLSKVNWLECHEFTFNSLIKKACDLWNTGIKNTKEIAKIIKLSRDTIVNYLKKGSEIGWCDYNAKEVKMKNGFVSSQKRRKKVVQIKKDGEIIKEWNSISEASHQLNITISAISQCLNGKYKTAGGFKWVIKSDYEKQLNLLQNN